MTKEEKRTQRDDILQWLEEKGSITAPEAAYYLGILQLAARLTELKKMGYAFDKTPEKGVNRYGRPTRCIRYRVAA